MGMTVNKRLEAPLVVGCDRVLCRGTGSLPARPRADGSLSGSETEVDNGFIGPTILHNDYGRAITSLYEYDPEPS
jgi:hypothetical protein